MYKNRIRCLTPNRDPQFFIRRSEIAFDERVRYIESVCQVLIESRFGACLAEPVTIDLSDHPELEPAAFSDLLDNEPNRQAPFYTLLSQGRNAQTSCLRSGKFSETHDPRATKMQYLNIHSSTHNSTAALTPNQGRGSP